MKNRFVITDETCIIGFQEHAYLSLLKPVDDHRMVRTRLCEYDDLNAQSVRKLIEYNSSLRVDFGWCFESEVFYRRMMNDCLEQVIPVYPNNISQMTSDRRCNWLGFVPFNVFERATYQHLDKYELIHYNNELIDFQIELIKVITEHKIFRQHAILRDERYQFLHFKNARNSRDKLAESYRYFMDSLSDISGLKSIHRDLLEQYIGCHFLYEPDLFFELLEFSILKGEIYG